MNHSSEDAPGNSAAECGSHSRQRLSKAARPWYCIQTHPGQAELAIRHMTYQGFPPWYPKQRRDLPAKPGKPTKPRYLPLFPNYMFVTFDRLHDHWHPLMNTNGVKHLFRFANRPEPLRPVDVRLIESQEDVPPHPGAKPPPLVRAILIRKQAFEQYAGQELTIVNHMWLAGNTATCQWSDAQRVGLLMTILGKPVKLTLPRNQVTPSDISA